MKDAHSAFCFSIPKITGINGSRIISAPSKIKTQIKNIQGGYQTQMNISKIYVKTTGPLTRKDIQYPT